MQLEEIQLAIRPRTILECFDVTFLFCGRHWLGLLLSASAGILPLACFNWWIADFPTLNWYASYMIVAMEIPLATMWITLYLGQTIFTKRLSLSRMFKDGLRAIPGLCLFQVLIRGLCLLLVVLSPVVYFGMYFLNEIILLEKTPLSKIWNRRTAINKYIMGRIISTRFLELIVLIGGMQLLALLFRAISAIWEDELDPYLWLFSESEQFQDSPLFADWQSHASFWVTIVFLTVFRFITYLDCRIRREGWDVELKLRAQADFYRQREASE